MHTKLRIVSYNIRHGLGMDGRVDLTRIASVLRALNPDIVALQEIDRNNKRSGKQDQMKVLGAALGMEARFKQSCFMEDGEYGIGVLSRFPITKTVGYTLSQVKGREPRSALEVQVHVPGVKEMISFLSIHADFNHLTADIRVQEIGTLLELLEDHKNPLILAGDFNATRNSPSLRLLETSGWDVLDKNNAPTFQGASVAENIEIDYVALKNFIPKMVKHEVIEEKRASDHFPIIVDLEF